MSCEDTTATVAFVDSEDRTVLEITPQTMDFNRDLGEFDFARLKFDSDVAQIFEGRVKDSNSILSQTFPVVIKINGDPVHRMLYMPDGVTFGSDSIHMELHDCRKYLQRGVIDLQYESVTLKDAYKEVFESRQTFEDGYGSSIFEGIKFTVPDEAFNELINTIQKGPLFFNPNNPDFTEAVTNYREPGEMREEAVREIEQDNVKNIIEGHYAIDLEQVSPWEAINELNKKFGVRTWVQPDGYLYVGSRTATGITHLAAPNDDRVWRLLPDGYNVTSPRDPVIKYVVRGKFIDDPSDGLMENTIDNLDFSRDTKSSEDYRAEGVAVRNDVDHGMEIVESVDASRDSLKPMAKNKIAQAQRDQWAGDLELFPEMSGSDWTDIRYVQVGDMIQTIPAGSSEEDNCGSQIQNEIFEITGVNQSISMNGEWKTRVSVIPVLDGPLNPNNVSTHMRYFDPLKEKCISANVFRKKSD